MIPLAESNYAQLSYIRHSQFDIPLPRNQKSIIGAVSISH